MSIEDRLEKAKQLAGLTEGSRGYLRGSRTTVDPDSPRGKHEVRMSELHIELKAKHMTSDQLDALLSFYGTDMGKSILHAQERIREEMSAVVASSMNDSSTKSVSLPKSKKRNEDDT